MSLNNTYSKKAEEIGARKEKMIHSYITLRSNYIIEYFSLDNDVSEAVLKRMVGIIFEVWRKDF